MLQAFSAPQSATPNRASKGRRNGLKACTNLRQPLWQFATCLLMLKLKSSSKPQDSSLHMGVVSIPCPVRRRPSANVERALKSHTRNDAECALSTPRPLMLGDASSAINAGPTQPTAPSPPSRPRPRPESLHQRALKSLYPPVTEFIQQKYCPKHLQNIKVVEALRDSTFVILGTFSARFYNDPGDNIYKTFVSNGGVPGGDEALNTMFGAIPSTSTRSCALVQQRLASKSDHIIFDEELRPPIFRRHRPSHFPPTDPIPVVVNGALKRKENEEIGAERAVKWVKLDPKKKRKGGGMTASKRKGDDDIDDKKPVKRARTHQRKAQEGASKSANK
ncbi:hypothetical protein DFH09DRAFT_1073062 [Mycena vulgaris]|nr:hypothetical protein DFH09DRAFT_1073062 [Mycena vulgaris]